MRRIKLTLMYDGAPFGGWQAQPNCVSVQVLVEEALSRMTGEGAGVVGASRTDAGVHALMQVAHFDTARDIPPDGFVAGLNSMLPAGISVLSAEEVSPDFHARKSSRGKLYTYRILVSRERNPFFEGRAWRLRRTPDIGAMREAASHLVGEHDFSSFRAAGCASRHAVRRIGRIEVKGPSSGDFGLREGEQIVELDFEGNGFLRHMIRNIVGTLVEAGEGKIAPEETQRILEAEKRTEAGRCAPASGLYLVCRLFLDTS